MVYSGLAYRNHIEDLFGHGVVMVWVKVSPLAKGVREELNSPKTWQWFEYLYNEIKKETWRDSYQRGSRIGKARLKKGNPVVYQ